jgi:hypothetical protein
VLLECLPGFWQATGPNKLTLPPNLPSSAAAKLQTTLDGESLATLPVQYCCGLTCHGATPTHVCSARLLQEDVQTCCAYHTASMCYARRPMASNQRLVISHHPYGSRSHAAGVPVT